MGRPQVMLIDPMDGYPKLDEIKQRLNKEHHLTSFIVSHEIPKVFEIVDRAAMLYEGKIIAIGTPDEIQSSDNEIVQKFLRGEIE